MLERKASMTNQLTNRHSGLPLFSGAFLMALSLSAWWTVMPFIIRSLGGSETHVGLAPAIHMGVYLAALLVAYHLHGLSYKRALCLSSGVMCVATVVIAAAMVKTKPGEDFQTLRIWIIISAGGLAGAAMAFFWPYAMGWASYGYEGQTLNRQLSYYNRSWSSAVIIGPFLGARLADTSLFASMLLPVLALFTCMVILATTRKPSPNTEGYTPPTVPIDDHAEGGPADYTMLCWMARMSLFTCWAGMAMLRSQFALLMTEHHGYTETQYGGILTIFALCNFSVLFLVGKFTGWHGRALPILLAQVPALLSLLLYSLGRTLPAFTLASAMHGASLGFAYSAHLYYGAAGKENRSIPMVIHEIIIALSMVAGSSAGGYLVQYGGLFWPYRFGAGLIVFGLLAQTSIWLAWQKKTP